MASVSDEVKTVSPILVAVDGSDESVSALRWAAAHARDVGRSLRVLTCYQLRYEAGETAGVSWERLESTKQAMTERSRAAIESVLGDEPVDQVVTLGPISQALIEHSTDASMIVLGTRCAFGLRGGSSSTTDFVTGRVGCPVISIPLSITVPALTW